LKADVASLRKEAITVYLRYFMHAGLISEVVISSGRDPVAGGLKFL